MPETATIPERRTNGKRKAGKPGAPAGNCNALIHGRRSTRHRIWRGLSKRRPDLAEVERDCNALCLQLEDEALAVLGMIDVATASAIDCAVGWLFHEGMARHQLESGNLPPGQQIIASREMAMAKSNRNKIIATLPVRKSSAGDPFAALRIDSARAVAKFCGKPAPSAVPSGSGSPEGPSEVLAGEDQP